MQQIAAATLEGRCPPLGTPKRHGWLPMAFAAMFGGMSVVLPAQVRDFVPVTEQMLLNPSPNDWLMLSRTYDEQRFSPLDQIDRGNVNQLRMVWSRGMARGVQETTPIVYRGVMYVVSPGAAVQALDATTGDVLWEYRRPVAGGTAASPSQNQLRARALAASARTKALAIFEDLIFYTSPDGYLVALDARSGVMRWETQAHDPAQGALHTSAPLVVERKVISGRSCRDRATCFIAAHDARTGKEVWRFHTTPAPGEPGGDSWGNVPVEMRNASTWGLPGSYDPVRRLLYWGIANPRPYPRLTRHGSADAVAASAPADLYSNSTVALHPDTGKLAWYYQHLPGDDRDSDHTHERILLRTPVAPDPGAVKWINPKLRSDEPRDIVVSVGEPGGIWALDRATGEFLWAMPFPYDVPEFHVGTIDVETGKTSINWDRVFKKDGDRAVTCFHNTRSYWATAYHPGMNALYIPYVDMCLDMEADASKTEGYGTREGIRRPGADRQKFAGIARVDMATGRMQRFNVSPIPGNGSMLATAGDVIFWGDVNRRFRAFDADTGSLLWETVLGGVIQTSTITYAVAGRQYVAVLTGDGQSGTEGLFRHLPDLGTPRGHNEIYVFALPVSR